MGAIPVEDRRYSYREYIELLRTSDIKIEFLDGRLRMMAGGTTIHNLIRDRLQGELFARKGDCMVRGSDTAVFVNSLNRYYFPDLTLVCGVEQQFTDAAIEQITNPTCIIEVLSESTTETDQEEKFHAYFSIPGFMEYILVDSRTMRVNTFYRNGPSAWSMRTYYKPDDLVEFRSMQVKLSVRDIYTDVDIDAADRPITTTK